MEIKNLFTPEAQQFGSQLAWVARKVAKPLEKPIQDIWQQFSANVQPAIQWVTDTVKTSFVEPVMKPIRKWIQTAKVIWEINTAFKGAWINIDDIKNLAEEEWVDFNLVLTKFQNNWIQVEGMEEIQAQQEAKANEIPQWEDLGIMGNIKEGAIGALRAGEQIPTIVGSWLDYLTQNVTSPLVSGWLEMIWAEWAAQKFREASKKTGEFYKKTGEDITMAGMTDGGTNPLTQKQIDARKFGGQMALTAPIGGGYVAWAKWVGWLALRSGVVGAWFGATQPIIDKGAEATMWDIATGWAIGGVTGAVAWPLIGKVIAPAIGGIASKTGKYGKALIKWGVEWAKKSIVRDVNAVKTWIQKWIQNRADIASTNINRMNAGQIRSFNEEIWVSPWKFLNDRWLNETGDDLVENLSKNLKLSRKSADEWLANIKGNFKAPTQEVATATVDDTGKFVTKQVDPVETMLRDNLENASSKWMSKESLRAKQLLEKYQEQWLSMTEINEAKRFLNANNKFSYFSDDVSPRKWFVTNLDNEVRKWQFQTAEQQGFTNLKDINKDTKAYYKLLEGIGWWQDKIAGNNPMWLTDWLAFNADPSVFLAKQVAQSNIAKRWYLKWLNALGWRKVQSEIKKPTNLIKNDIPNSNNSGNVPSSKRINVEKPIITPKKKVITPIVKPNTIKNESKVSEPVSSDTIPEGYFKNAFWEIQKNPSNKKGGFINIPEIGKKIPVKNPLVEEARKSKDFNDFWFNISDSTLWGMWQQYKWIPTRNVKLSDFNLWDWRKWFVSKKINQSQTQTWQERIDFWKNKIKKWEMPPVILREWWSDLQPHFIEDGHNRLRAYEQLGIEEVPVIDKKTLREFYTKNK